MENEKHKFGWVWKGGADLGRAATHSRQVIKTYMEFLKEPPTPQVISLHTAFSSL